MNLKMTTLIFLLISSIECFGQEIIHLGNKRELFVDNYLIERIDGINIVMHHPQDEGIVFFFDKPWEGRFSGYVTIIKENDLFRAYYRGKPEVGMNDELNEVICYAQSKDGINWEKPDLKIYQVCGILDNNVILSNDVPTTHNFCPFFDTNPKSLPHQKYKAVGGTHLSGLVAYVSSDGIYWKKLQQESIMQNGEFDSQNVIFWSESEKKYVCYYRTWSDGFFKGFRTVSRAVSFDFIHWMDQKEMTFGDSPKEHLYTHQTSPYFRAPHIYIAIGGRFMDKRQVLTEEQAKTIMVDMRYFKDCSDVYFMTSRGGYKYDRTFMEAFIRPGIGLNNWVSRSNYPALNVVQTSKSEMSIFVNQDYAQSTAHLHRYSIRLDGFTSVNAPYNGGEMITRLITFTGKELEINYSTSAVGEIKLEIQDERGLPIHGFSLEDSDTIIGNEIKRIVSWKGNTDLSSITSKRIRLRFWMKDADLFSLKFN